jgi:hypothetical protein
MIPANSSTPTCGGLNVTTPDVWYVVTGTGSQSYVTTCMFGWNCDTVISVCEGNCRAFANDDAGPPYVGPDSAGTVNERCSAVEFYAEEDVRYYVLVHALAVTGRPFLDHFVFFAIVSLWGCIQPPLLLLDTYTSHCPHHFSSVMYGMSKYMQNRIALLQGTVLEGKHNTYKLNIHTKIAFKASLRTQKTQCK